LLFLWIFKFPSVRYCLLQAVHLNVCPSPRLLCDVPPCYYSPILDIFPHGGGQTMHVVSAAYELQHWMKTGGQGAARLIYERTVHLDSWPVLLHPAISEGHPGPSTTLVRLGQDAAVSENR
jgi:hypothetical protein